MHVSVLVVLFVRAFFASIPWRRALPWTQPLRLLFVVDSLYGSKPHLGVPCGPVGGTGQGGMLDLLLQSARVAQSVAVSMAVEVEGHQRMHAQPHQSETLVCGIAQCRSNPILGSRLDLAAADNVVAGSTWRRADPAGPSSTTCICPQHEDSSPILRHLHRRHRVLHVQPA